MKLSILDKDMLRQKIIEHVEALPFGSRVHLNKEMLEQLIFTTQTDKNGTIVKLPVWTGYFLSKIDLSEIDFSNVYFGIIDSSDNVFGLKKVSYCDTNSRYAIVFSDTNANIDFSLCYAGWCESCDFSYTNLRNSNYQDLHYIKNSSLKNCNLENCFENKYFCYNVDFSSNDMSEYEVDINELIENIHFDNLDLSNTGLNINLKSNISQFNILMKKYQELQTKFYNNTITKEELEKMKKFEANKKFRKYWFGLAPEHILAKMIRQGNLDDCYVNYVRIHNSLERRERCSQRKDEHDTMINDFLSDLENQTLDIRKKMI